MSVRVVRAHQSSTLGAPPPSLRVAQKVSATVVAAREEAQRTIEAAQAEAQRILADARAQVQALEADAQRRGVEAGRAQVAARLVQLSRADQKQLDRILPIVVAAVRAVTEKLVGEHLQQSDTALLAWVGAAMDRLRAARRVRIFAAPETARRLAERVSGLASALDQVIEIQESSELDALTLRLESELGDMTVEVSTRVDLLVETLEELLRDEIRGTTGPASRARAG